MHHSQALVTEHHASWLSLRAALSANLGDNYIDEVEMGNVTAEELTDVGFFFIGKPVSGCLVG